MTVEFICVGTEILLGNIVNTNAAFLARACADLGLSCFYQSVVGDNQERLLETLDVASKRSDIVILSGGLGPTKDDLTKETVALHVKKEMYPDEQVKAEIQEYFDKLGRQITENNWKQAMVPEGAIVVHNKNGTAPGIIVETENCKYILLPGPPNELIPMFQEDIVPYLRKWSPVVIYSQMVKVCGIGESQAETMISDLMEAQDNPTIAPYAKMGEVHFRVTAKADNKKDANKLIRPVVKELKKRFGNHVFTTDESVTLEEAVVDLLLANDLTVSTAESCTAGLLSARLVNVSGVSEVFKSGYVTYSNKAKRRIIGVKKGTLDKYGAVSAQVAEQMVKGLALVSKADVSVAITGIAGPDGGTEEKPVGLVYIACCVKGTTTVKEFHFTGNREKIRLASVSQALILMRDCILQDYSKKLFE